MTCYQRLRRRASSAGLRTPPLLSKFLAYFNVGAVCALSDIALFWSLLHVTGLTYVSFITSFILSTGLNYWLSARFVFSLTRSRGTTLALVYAASAMALLINFLFFSTALEMFGAHPLLAKILGVGAGFIWNFSSCYFWIFRE